jgi:hypothetical protein
MAEPAAELRAALTEAVEGSEFVANMEAEQDDWTELDEALSEGKSAPAADDGNEPGRAESTEEAEGSTEPSEAVEIPSEYFGVSLDGIPEDKARAILAMADQQESYIHQLQARLATKPEEPTAPESQEPEEVTDEALLIAMGFDPSDEYGETAQLAPHVLPLARTILDLEAKVDQLSMVETARSVETQWNKQLDELEQTYGKLPGDRIAVLKYAIDEGIASPFETYFRIAAPAKREVETAVTAARRVAAARAAAGGVKPRSSANATSTPIDPKTTSLRDAVKQAMAESERETGLSWKNILRKTRVEQ